MLPFTGILTHVETPSDKSPSGAQGHRVVLDRKAVEDALWSLEDMAVDFKDGWDGHDAQRKCGLIKRGWLVGDSLHVEGFLYHRDFPAMVRELRRSTRPLGMSYELAEARIQEMRASIWRIVGLQFTGAAILYADKAAYATSTFNIAAADEPIGENGKLRISFAEANEITGEMTLKG